MESLPMLTSKQMVWLCFSLTLLSGVSYSVIAWSSFPLSVIDLWYSMSTSPSPSIEQQIIRTIRIPRVLSGMVIGANLAVAGLLMQGITRNRLASPSVLGINSGAACVMALGALNLPILSEFPSIVLAGIGGMLSGATAMLVGGVFSSRSNPLKLVLAGIALNALLIGLTRASVILVDDNAYTIITWLAGSISSLSWKEWHTLWPISLVGLTMAITVSRHLNLIALGNESAISLGIHIPRTQAITSIAILLLTASSVAVAGPIGFVGLLIPHIAKRLVGSNYVVLVPACALLGAALVTWADALSRSIAFPAETPVGAITALIGTPCFIYLAIRHSDS
ncbi:iron chelate uptake ABC transporter family permease subunit [Vibrio cholerae]